MKVREYLATLKRVIITCRPEDTIETAATLLATNRIGAMPVRDANGRIIGMFSERDIIRAFSQRGKEVERCLVSDLMTTKLVVCAPDDLNGGRTQADEGKSCPAPARDGRRSSRGVAVNF